MKNTTVLTMAIHDRAAAFGDARVDRRGSANGGSRRRRGADSASPANRRRSRRRHPSGYCWISGNVTSFSHWLLSAVERAVRLQRLDRLVHASDERVALGEDEPEVLLLADRRELADDDAVLHLADQHVHVGRRRVGQLAVDLAVAQRADHVDRPVEHGRLLVGRMLFTM